MEALWPGTNLANSPPAFRGTTKIRSSVSKAKGFGLDGWDEYPGRRRCSSKMAMGTDDHSFPTITHVARVAARVERYRRA
jgi:hypothetical protein